VVNQAISAVAGITSALPGFDVITDFLSKSLTQLGNIVSGAVTSVSSASLELAISTILTVLSTIRLIGWASIIKPIIDVAKTTIPQLRKLISCQAGATQLSTDEFRCYSLADLYREALEDSVKISPALNLPADASEELRRFTTGSLTLLDLMAKTSIAKTNDALLATRPIFAADLLQEYRAELLRLAPPEDIRNYADISLGSIVGFSNSLEACLRVAADPVGALDELNKDLDAEADEDDFEDEDDEYDEEDEEDKQYEQDKQ